MDLKLKGKRALVTGASKGIGLAVAQSLAAEGCHLDIVGRGVPALERARDMLRQAAPDIDVRIHGADLSRVEDQERLAQACAGIDILVNNAGSNPAGDLDDTSDKIWRNAWDLKVFGYINLTRSIFHAMKQRRDGVIVNIIGYAGERLFARYIIGSTGNAALMAFSRSVGVSRRTSACVSSRSIPATPQPTGPRACCARSPRTSSARPSDGATSSAS